MSQQVLLPGFQNSSTVLMKVHIRVESPGLSFSTTGIETGSVFVSSEAARWEFEGHILLRRDSLIRTDTGTCGWVYRKLMLSSGMMDHRQAWLSLCLAITGSPSFTPNVPMDKNLPFLTFWRVQRPSWPRESIHYRKGVSFTCSKIVNIIPSGCHSRSGC